MNQIKLLLAAIGAVCVVPFFFLFYNGDAPAADDHDYEKLARRFVAQLAAAEMDTAVRDFDATMTKALPPEKLTVVWRTIETNNGAFQETQNAMKTVYGANVLVDINCRFEKSSAALRVVYDRQAKIAGFFVRKPFGDPPPVVPDTGEQVQLKTETGSLSGTIDLPEGPGPSPVVLFIQGSGPTDRNGNQPGLINNNLKQLSEGLTARGFATLRYDKRGIAASRAAGREASMKFDDFVADATGWIQLLRNDPRFSHVVVLGHSQGSLVAAICGQRSQVDACISIAGAGEPIQNVLRRQLAPKLEGDLQQKAFAIIDEIASTGTSADVPEELVVLFRPSVQSFLHSWMKYDPVTEFAALKIPTLLIQGSTDIQVTENDLNRLQKSKGDAESIVIQDMNHVLKHCESLEDQASTYSDPSHPVVPELIECIAAFLKRHS